MTLLLRDADVRKLVDYGEIIAAIESALHQQANGTALVPDRLNAAHGGRFLRMLPAILGDSDVMGFKAFHGSLDTGVRYLLALYRLSDGAILALIDASYLTAVRTGATSAVATALMARPEAASVGIIGSGLEAETNLTAISQVRRLASAKVFSPRPDRRASFARRMTDALGIDVAPCSSPESAADGTDIVIVATNTGLNGPVAYEGRWATPGQHIVSIGSTMPSLREIDPPTFDRADSILVDAPLAQLLAESGDVQAAASTGTWTTRVQTLAQYVSVPVGAAPGADRITLFKSVGTALQDVAAADTIYRRAAALGLGDPVDEIAAAKFF